VNHVNVRNARVAMARRMRPAAAMACALAMLLSAAVVYPQTEQLSFTGTVVGRNGAAKPNVAVDVLGPTRVYTETDASGHFTVRLRPGSYVIRVREGNRWMEFPQAINEKSNKAQFSVAW
jgi:carboxypeptidase family protein